MRDDHFLNLNEKSVLFLAVIDWRLKEKLISE